MNMTPGWSQHTDMNLPMSPVILPLAGAKEREANDAGRSAEDMGQTTDLRRFSFPAIPQRQEWAQESPPMAIWPTCDCTESVQAGVKLAAAVVRRLPVDRPSVLALTSPGDGDGKTSLMAVLAPELAKQTSSSVLAVDADFRKASLTSQLTISAGRTAHGASVIYPTDRAGLSVLPMSHHRECRGADADWIEEMRDSWPLVLLDMASLRYGETSPVLRHCDSVCLVVRVGYTARRAVAEAARVISACGGRLLGCVVVGGE